MLQVELVGPSTEKTMIEKLLRTFCVCASYFAVVGRILCLADDHFVVQDLHSKWYS